MSAPAAYGLNPYTGSHPSGSYASRTSPPRTPSPTPSDIEELRKPVIDLKLLDPRRWLHRKYIPWIIGLSILLVLVVLMSLYHKQIVDWLTPLSNKLKDLKGGWAIPIGILFVISFPPLFGHEIVAVLCGVVWGLWVGFAIVAAGTYLGEVGNFYAFKSLCAAHGRKLEQTQISYACLAKLVRERGFVIAVVARFSAIPGHFTTAVFSTCGMGIIVFSIAAILSLPKQLITVYLGVVIKQSSDGTETKSSTYISDSVLVVSIIVTIAAAYWIQLQMAKVKPEVLRDRRRAKARKEWEAYGRGGVYGQSAEHLTSQSRVDVDSESVFNPRDSDEGGYGGGNAPYSMAPVSVQPQRWDAHGRAIPLLYETTDGRRQDSMDVVGWDRRDQQQPSYGGPRYGPGQPGGSGPSNYSGQPRTQSQSPPRQQPVSYPPPGGPPFPPGSSASPYHSPYNPSPSLPPTQPQSYSQQQQQQRISPPQTAPPGGASSPYNPPSQPPPSAPAIPSTVPRYQLTDGPGPAPSIMSDAPTYHTQDPSPRQGTATEPTTPYTPRIPPPPQ